MRPNPTTGLIVGSVYDNDQILCGNVASTEWLVTEFKSSGQTARQPRLREEVLSRDRRHGA
jgi:hypothetical protein